MEATRNARAMPIKPKKKNSRTAAAAHLDEKSKNIVVFFSYQPFAVCVRCHGELIVPK